MSSIFTQVETEAFKFIHRVLHSVLLPLLSPLRDKLADTCVIKALFPPLGSLLPYVRLSHKETSA